MTIAFDANEKLKRDAPAIVYVDGMARVQQVTRDDEPLFYDLISSCYDITGIPVILNTSFNGCGEPIVCTA